MSGEETQAAGAEGVLRAKLWLESTTRANVQWINPEPLAVAKLTFPWRDKGAFSFDLGGVLLGGDLHNQEFLGESKYYKSAEDQGSHYRSFLGRCYRAYELRPERCDHFLWITWSPFLVTKWDELRTPTYVREAVLGHRARTLGESDMSTAGALVSDDKCKDIASKVWLLFLTDKQEKLCPTREHLAEIRRYNTLKGV